MLKKSIFIKKAVCLILLCCFVAASLPVRALAQGDEQELFLVAQKAFDDGFYDVATRYITQFLEQFPQSEKKIEINLLLGQCYFFKGQYLKAYEIFQSLLAFDELKDATLFWLGETYLKGSDYKQSQQYYQELIKLYPDSAYVPQAYYSLGWVFYEQSQFDQAFDAFAALLKKFPIHQLSEDAAFKLGEIQYNQRNYESAIKYFQEYLSKYPQTSRQAEAYFYIAESYYYLEKYLEAIGYYAQAAEKSLDSKVVFMANVSLGWSYLKLEKFDLSQQYFDKALAFAQEKGILTDDVYLGQASLYSERGENTKAIEAYDQMIQTFPNSPRMAEARLGKANIAFLLKQYDNAISEFRAIIDGFATNEQKQEAVEKAYFGLAWSYLKKGDIDESVNVFSAIKDKAQNKTVKISALTQIGDAYQDVNQPEKAIEIYDQILRDYPDSAYTDYVQYRQGIALLKLNKVEMATLSFQSLRSNFPGSRYINDTNYYLAVAYFKKGDWASAKQQIEAFMKNLTQGSEFLAEATYILALSDFNLKDYENALKRFEDLMKNYPDRPAIVKSADMNMAKCLYKLGKVPEALKRFKLLVNQYPQTEIAQESLIWLGDHFLASSEFSQAAAYYEKFIEDFPGGDQVNLVRYQLAQAYQARQDYDKAINVLKDINAQGDQELFVKAKLAVADIFSRELDGASAMKTYQNILATAPEFKRDAYIKIADVYKDEKDFTQAIDAYHKALESPKGLGQRSNAEVQFLIGDSYHLFNNPEQAIEEYLKIPYVYPNDTPWVIKSYLQVARIFENQEKWEDATTIYNKILTYQTDEAKFAQERLDWINENNLNLSKP